MNEDSGPVLVISYGMPKSASTFCWMILKDIMAAAPSGVANLSRKVRGTKSVREDYVLNLDGRRIHDIRAEAGQRNVVLKTHSHARHFPGYEIAYPRTHVFVQYRDPREISLSLIDHGRRSRALGIPDFAECVDIPSTWPFIDQAIERARSWLQRPGAVAVDYDSLCFNNKSLVENLADRLGVAVDSSAIAAKYEDKDKIIQFNKGEPNRWIAEMPCDVSEQFLERYAQYYTDGRFVLG